MADVDAFVIGNMDHFENINYVDMWATDGLGSFLKPVFKLTTGGTTGYGGCAWSNVMILGADLP